MDELKKVSPSGDVIQGNEGGVLDKIRAMSFQMHPTPDSIPAASPTLSDSPRMQELRSRFSGDPLMVNSMNAISKKENTPEEQSNTIASLKDLVEGAGGAVGSLEVVPSKVAMGKAMDEARVGQHLKRYLGWAEDKVPQYGYSESGGLVDRLTNRIKSPEDVSKLEELARNHPEVPELNDQTFNKLITSLKSRFAR